MDRDSSSYSLDELRNLFPRDCRVRVTDAYAESSDARNARHDKGIGWIRKVTGYYDGTPFPVASEIGWHRPDRLEMV
jgi:hypothetical protein